MSNLVKLRGRNVCYTQILWCSVMTHVIWKDSLLQSTNVTEHSLRNCLHRDANEHRVSLPGAIAIASLSSSPRANAEYIRKITKCSASDFVLRESDVPKLRCTALRIYSHADILRTCVTTSVRSGFPLPPQSIISTKIRRYDSTLLLD